MILDGGPLTVEQVNDVAAHRTTVIRSADLASHMAAARSVVEAALDRGATVYGVNTGFGALAGTRVEPSELLELQVNLLRSHAAGVGPPLRPETVRAMLLLRARTLAQGHSGVRPAVVERYLDFLDRDLLPVVPSQGSVGASGDLAQFAHLALPIIGEGLLDDGAGSRPAAVVLSEHGLSPLRLEAKEGLSLLNGTEGMLAVGVLATRRAETLVRTADLACAMSVEALMGSTRPFRPELHALRPHPGQGISAAAIAAALAGSEIGASHVDDFRHAVQDAYSLRCAPQVHGAIRDTISHARSVFEIELGSVVDNPIVLPATGEVISGGNFHGQPLAFALDFMGIAITELGSISERRTDRILDPERSAGLPAFLSPRPGVQSGFMLAQYTAAALVAENRVLAHPASIDSIPTSGSQEDHVSMGWGAGRKLESILVNTTAVLAIELLCAAAGVEYRSPLRPGPGASAGLELIRRSVPRLDADRPIGADIEAVAEMITQGLFETP